MSYVMRVNPINVNNQWVNSEKFYFDSPVRVEIINFLDGLYSELDWVGLFKKDDISSSTVELPNSLISIYWTYPKNFANNTFTINDLTSGVWSNVAENGEIKRPDWEQYKNGLPEGEYTICLMYNDGRKILARINFTISNSAINYSAPNDNGLTSNKSVYAVGEDIVVSVNMNYTKDWIGLYQGTSAVPGRNTSLLWTYIDSNGTETCNMSIVTNDRENGVMVYSRDLVREMEYTYYELWGKYLSKSVLEIADYKLFLLVNGGYVTLDEIPIKIDTGFIWALEGLTADDKDVYPYGSTPDDRIYASGENFVHQWGGVGSGAPAINAKNNLKLRGWIVNAFNKEGLPTYSDATGCYYYRVNNGDWKQAIATNQARQDLSDAGITYADADGFYSQYPNPYSYINYNWKSAGFLDLTIPTRNLFDEPNRIEVAFKNYKDEMITFIIFADVHGRAYELSYDSGTLSDVEIPTKDGIRVLSDEDLPTLTADGAEFIGWFYSYNMDKKAEAGQHLLGDTLLRAKWKVPVFDRFVTQSELTQSNYENDNDLSLSYIENRPFYEYYDERATLLKQTVTSTLVEEVTLYDTIYNMNRINLEIDAWTKEELFGKDGEVVYGYSAYCGGKYVLYIDNETYTAEVPEGELAVGIRFYTNENTLKALLYADLNNYNSKAILYLNDAPNKSHSIRLDRFNATRFNTGETVYEFPEPLFTSDSELPKEYFSGKNPFHLCDIENIDLFEASNYILCNFVTFELVEGSMSSWYEPVPTVHSAIKINSYIDLTTNGKYYIYKSLLDDKEYKIQISLKATENNTYEVNLVDTPLPYFYTTSGGGKTVTVYNYKAQFGISCPGVKIESVPDTKLIKYLDNKFINPDLLESLNSGPIITTTAELSKMNSSDYNKVISITGKGENTSYYDSFSVSGTLTSCVSIGSGSFRYCRVSSLNIPVCNYIGADAFTGGNLGYNRDFICPSLTSAGSYAFANTSGIRTITVPVLYEMPNAFLQNSGVVSVNAPLLTKVMGRALMNNANLTTLNAPNITYVDSEAFFGCNSLEITKDFIEKLDYIGYHSFVGCKDDGATKYVFKDGVVLGQDIFYSFNNNVEEIELPENFTFKSSSTFKNCYNLKKVVCKGDFNSDYTFSSNTPIRYFDCYGVAKMNYHCFSSFSSNDTDMIIILRDETTMSTVNSSAFGQSYTSISTNAQIKVYVPESLKSTYENNSQWQYYLNRTNTLGEPLMVINTIEGSEYEIK